MLKLGHVPETMKEGVITTLYKGGRKRRDDPSSYRAITLSSVILKVFETVLLERCKDDVLGHISRQQGGFQAGLGCLMTSFVLRESLQFAREHSSKVYVCWLDGRSAFDCVWHDGLFFKLIEMGVDPSTLTALRSMYENSTCHVKFQGKCSKTFPVKQGTKQGGKASPILYLAFIDGLIKELENSHLGMCLYDLDVSTPTVADDMVLVSFTRDSLQGMLNICDSYSRRWRYFYNASKCKVVIFNSPGIEKCSVPFVLGPDVLPEGSSYCHLGVICDNTLSAHECVIDAGRKLRGTFLSLNTNGIDIKTVSPKTLAVIYGSVVLPRALYGCELWSQYSRTDIASLQRDHLFCLKTMQGLRKSCNSLFVLLAAGMIDIETIVDHRKLIFFGQLCRLPGQYLAKHVFIHRLVRYVNVDKQCLGFIPDIVRLLTKYELLDCVAKYLCTGLFPSKCRWKKIVKKHVDERAFIKMTNSLDNGEWLQHSIITPGHCSPLYNNGIYVPTLCRTMMNAVSNIVSRQFTQKCNVCSLATDNGTIHKTLFCHNNHYDRERLFQQYIVIYGFKKFLQLMQENPTRQCQVLLQAALTSDLCSFRNPSLAWRLFRIIR